MRENLKAACKSRGLTRKQAKNMNDISDNKIVERQIKNEILENADVLLASIRKACDSGLFEYKRCKWVRKFLINFDFKVCDIIASSPTKAEYERDVLHEGKS